ncbi:MAG: fibronectin type III domain-containing protein [Archangium sp.]
MQLSANNPGAATMTLLRSTTRGGPYTVLGQSTNDNTVAPQTTYFYVMRADNGSTLGELSNEVQVTTPAMITSVPTGVAVTPTDSAVNVSWTPVPEAASYQVGTSNNQNGPFTPICTTTDSHCVQSATNATLTWFAVRSGNGNGIDFSAWSPALSATATSNGLATPSVYATAGNSVVTLQWASVTGATTYRVYRRTPFISDWVEVLPPTLTLSFNDTTVTNDTTYVYQVQALNAGAGTSSAYGTLIGLPVRPNSSRAARVTGFNVTPTAEGFLVSWDPVPGATNYTVRSGFRRGGSIAAQVTSCTTNDPFDTRCNLSGMVGTNYWVSMSVTTPEGETASTDEIGPVQSSLASPVLPGIGSYGGNGLMQVSATTLANTQYRFARRFRARDWQVLPPANDAYFLEPQLNGVEVRYALQAVNANGASGWSYANFTAPSFANPPVPSSVVVTPVNGGVTVEWDPVIGVPNVGVQVSTDLAGGSALQLALSTDAMDTIRSFLFTGSPRYIRVVPSGSSITARPVVVTPTSAVPAAPNLTLTPGLQGADLDWTAVNGATSYRVYHRVDRQPWRLILNAPSSVLSMRDLSVENGETVNWGVVAVTPQGVTGWSPLRFTVANPNFPPMPLNVVSAPADQFINLSWDAVPGATGYSVQWNNGTTWISACSFSSQYETHCRVNAANGTSPVVRVAASNATGTGLFSVPLGGSTPSAAYPDAITGATVTANGPGSLRVSWNASPDATSYRVFRRPTNGIAAAVMDVTTTSFDDSGLTSGTQYIYYVSGVNSTGLGAWSFGSTPIAAP